MQTAPQRTDDDMIGSASVTALMRYLLSQESGLSQNPDYLGKYFVGGKWKSYLKDPESSKEELQIKLPGCIYYHLIRTKNFDTSLLKWVQSEKNSQVIILGAGFDSRAIRFEEILKNNNIRIFEVDLKAMLNHKEEIIDEDINANIDHVSFVPCNFTKDNIIEKLSEFGCDFNLPTLVLWEGVTYFLTQENIEYYLQLFRDSFKNKLQITFDYAFRDYIEGDLDFYGAKELYDILIDLGEPHLFGLNFDEVEDPFDRHGFRTKLNNTSLMLAAQYITDRYGNSVGKPHTFHGMAEVVKN